MNFRVPTFWKVLECPGNGKKMSWNCAKCPGKSWKLMNLRKLRYIVISNDDSSSISLKFEIPSTFLGKMPWKLTQKCPGKSCKWFNTFEWELWTFLQRQQRRESIGIHRNSFFNPLNRDSKKCHKGGFQLAFYFSYKKMYTND